MSEKSLLEICLLLERQNFFSCIGKNKMEFFPLIFVNTFHCPSPWSLRHCNKYKKNLIGLIEIDGGSLVLQGKSSAQWWVATDTQRYRSGWAHYQSSPHPDSWGWAFPVESRAVLCESLWLCCDIHTGQMLILCGFKATGLLVLVMLINFNWKGESTHFA
jgi:hypothetical protein